MDAEQYIVGLLSDAAAVTAITRDIMPAERRPQLNSPAVIYQLIGSDPLNTLCSGDAIADYVTLQVDCWAKNYLDAQRLAKAVRAALTASDYIHCNNRRSGHDTATKYYRISLDFEVFTKS